MKKSPIVIIGGGLSGLSLAYFLEQKGYDFIIVEAKKEIGGRIETIHGVGIPPIEMGATWVHAERQLLDFLEILGVNLFKQDLGDKAWVDTHSNKKVAIEIPDQEPMFRVDGGTNQIINKLKEKISKERIVTGVVVDKIEEINNKEVRLSTSNGVFECNKVVLTLPPKLLVENIQFYPSLSKEYLNLAKSCATWMEYSIKFALSFKKKFWKTFPYTLFSQTGIIQEMYDHSSQDNSQYALKGFLNARCLDLSKEERERKVVEELQTLYGEAFIKEYDYVDKVWLDDHFVSNRAFPYAPPKQYNGFSELRVPQWDGKLLFGGTETSAKFPGYMEGALDSAKNLLNHLQE